ncbi:hypothetical protein Pmar_PMAR015910 [Perkinsus marinus ATCC 50983]|uniref:Uncharacterized protein n=1 Tax=Perkinsus marinus (strain ATCC 50983 / TXsc) TaxID=423536 RepID=C5L425_PERM5|nr:hypothetical protein Pmar_PMAR015910 [Perkinsus marinus ATCC 50983]EER08491.1 hypothetical protein Pmar_PMAR015910 [Perkinsus marinus ATCC 50983]|eukprot:XP_002776675.1 hypothetical protein Pmar_PMAR015910 [Perkinsus marinus ATCC 50983]
MSSLSPQSPEPTNMVPRPSDVFAEPPAFVPDDSEPLDLISFMALEEADVPVDGGTRTEGETADPTDKALKLERFSGAPKTIGLVEWRRRFVALSAARRWSWPMVVAKLKAFLTGPAARLDPKAAVEAIWAALDKAYGLTVPQALARLRSCTYDPAVPGPSVDELAANIIEWCTVAWAFLDPVHRDSVAASLFWASLPKTSQTKHIYGQLTAGKAPGSLTLVASVESARPLFEEERDEVTELSMVGTSSTGPDRSRGHAPPFSRSSSRSSHPYGAGHLRGRRHGSTCYHA